MMGEIKVDLTELKAKVKVSEDNVRYFNALCNANGSLFTLDVRPYYDMFLEFGVNFSGPINDD